MTASEESIKFTQESFCRDAVIIIIILKRTPLNKLNFPSFLTVNSTKAASKITPKWNSYIAKIACVNVISQLSSFARSRVEISKACALFRLDKKNF